MGEIADGMINGDFDAETGEYLGEGFGFPRVQRRGKIVGQHGSPYHNPLKGIRNYFSAKGIKKGKQRELMIEFVGEKDISNEDLAELITNDWGNFVKFVKKKL